MSYFVYYANEDAFDSFFTAPYDGVEVRYIKKKFFGPFRTSYEAEQFLQKDASADDLPEIWEFNA